MSDKSSIQSLIKTHERNLQKLKEKEASLGLHTPVHILTEIEDTEAKIKSLHRDLESLSDSPNVATQSDSTVSNETSSSRRFLIGIVTAITILALGGATWVIIQFNTPTKAPITWQYVLDLSSGMQDSFTDDDASKWEVARRKLIDELAVVPDDINVGLRVFGLGTGTQRCTETNLLVEPYPGQATEIQRQLMDLTPTGSKAPLSEAVLQAFNEDFELNPNHKNALVVLTTGQDTCDPEGLPLVADMVRRLEIKADTYIVGISIEDPIIETNLQTLADASDGVFISVENASELENTLDNIHQNLADEGEPSALAPTPTPTSTSTSTPTNTPIPTNTPTVTPTPTPTPIPHMTTKRSRHTATQLSDGRVLVVGGNEGESDIAEIYDPATGGWTTLDESLDTYRRNGHTARHTATLLADGRVLVAGGRNKDKITSDSAEIYDPILDTWTETGSLNIAREGHTATLLLDGRVLVAGGYVIREDGHIIGEPLNSVELYDPTTGLWTSTDDLNTPRRMHTATLLPNGKVVVVGGASSASDRVEIYDPVSETWTETSNLGQARDSHKAILLANAQIFVVGGEFGNRYVTQAELYNPVTGSWDSAGEMKNPRIEHTVTELSDGRVLVVGGTTDKNGLTSVEIYDPDTNSWSEASPLNVGRWRHTATLLSDGTVLVAGGKKDSSNYINSVEFYDPDTDIWTLK